MRKFFFNTFLLLIFFLISIITILSTIGIETNKFNSVISSKIKQSNSNVDLNFKTIKFRLDFKKLGLFLETANPNINYKKISIPTNNIKVYIDFLSILKSEIRIKKIVLNLNEFNLKQLKKLSVSSFKPSNFTSFLNNKVKEGIFKIELEVYLDKKNNFDNFIAKGSVSNFKSEIKKNLSFDNSSFNFFADKSDILLKNIIGNVGPIKISEGDLQIKLSKEVTLISNFKSIINYDKNFNTLDMFGKNLNNIVSIDKFTAEFYNYISINLDETYKLTKYNLKNNGKIIEAKINLEKSYKNFFNKEKIDLILLSNSEIKTDINSKNSKVNILGKYSINQNTFLPFDLENIFSENKINLKLKADYDQNFDIELLNYKKQIGSIANISLILEKQNEKLKIQEFSFKEKKNIILAEEIMIQNDKFISMENFIAKTSKENGVFNNDFKVSFGKKININGEKFDASNLPKIINKGSNRNDFSHINKDIEIDFKNVTAPLAENLKNFKLIGTIDRGKFSKISSKGDFGGNNFLDISMKKDPKNKKKYLEIYSDLSRPLLTEYNFFKGLSGGNLLFTSIIEGENSYSKLKIENFKVINAPNMVKLLSLADLSGLADLAEGEGISFDILEIDMEKNKNSLKINEIIALGPSISVLMDGYQDPKVVSLRGTLVPAKTLNNIISKIPVLGNIVIPKEVGEGLFGISFKMKGPPNKIKTTINPIRTLTPRFIQKIIDKKKIK